MNRQGRTWIAVSAVVLLGWAPGGETAFGTHAIVVSSTPFSIGMGAVGHSFTPVLHEIWDTSETSTVNTVPGSPYGLTLTVESDAYSGGGPNFNNRVMSSNGSGSGRHDALPFTATITATYSGPTTPPTMLQIQIDSISIYSLTQISTTVGQPEMAFSETTPGHLGQSAFLSVNQFNSSANVSGHLDHTLYNQLVWDPMDDFSQPLGSATRTFTLIGDDRSILEGFEIEGQILVVVPEPSGLALLSLSGMVLLRRQRH